MDHALHSGRCTVRNLRDSVPLVPEHHRDAVERAIALTDAACESVGESRAHEGQDGRAALAAEKARETDIVDLGYEVVRLVWADLLDPAGVARRVRAARTRAVNRRRANPAPH